MKFLVSTLTVKCNRYQNILLLKRIFHESAWNGPILYLYSIIRIVDDNLICFIFFISSRYTTDPIPLVNYKEKYEVILIFNLATELLVHHAPVVFGEHKIRFVGHIP